MADQELAAIRDAWDKESGGRDEATARALSDAYVSDHPELFETLSGLSEEACVESLETFRNAGWVDEAWRCQAWLFHAFEPRNIGGPLESKVRITQNG